MPGISRFHLLRGRMNRQTVTTLLLLTMAGTASAAGGGRTNVACDVVVLGGGAGGLHTAFRLGSKLGAGVCLFEKEDRLGGRIYDVARVPGGPQIGRAHV